MGEARQAMTPAAHLKRLLARARNPFDVPDLVLIRLQDAVLHQVEPLGRRHRNTPAPAVRCASYRHSFLLSDGCSMSLFELRHETVGAPEGVVHEVYAAEASLRRARRRVHRLMHEVHEPPEPGPSGPKPPAPAEARRALRSPRTRGYTGRDSADHARRLLRRAENADRPGEEVLRLLSTARGHEIVPVPRPHNSPACHVWCSVYEHAFLLADGREVSLYELEHNLSRTGRLVCEVYLEEAGADRAAHRRARDRGIDL
jgi:uncharacterized protein DUF6227